MVVLGFLGLLLRAKGVKVINRKSILVSCLHSNMYFCKLSLKISYLMLLTHLSYISGSIKFINSLSYIKKCQLEAKKIYFSFLQAINGQILPFGFIQVNLTFLRAFYHHFVNLLNLLHSASRFIQYEGTNSCIFCDILTFMSKEGQKNTHYNSDPEIAFISLIKIDRLIQQLRENKSVLFFELNQNIQTQQEYLNLMIIFNLIRIFKPNKNIQTQLEYLNLIRIFKPNFFSAREQLEFYILTFLEIFLFYYFHNIIIKQILKSNPSYLIQVRGVALFFQRYLNLQKDFTSKITRLWETPRRKILAHLGYETLKLHKTIKINLITQKQKLTKQKLYLQILGFKQFLLHQDKLVMKVILSIIMDLCVLVSKDRKQYQRYSKKDLVLVFILKKFLSKQITPMILVKIQSFTQFQKRLFNQRVINIIQLLIIVKILLQIYIRSQLEMRDLQINQKQQVFLWYLRHLLQQVQQLVQR
ncbi:transmembrane protein, putative (macronuclear) [Tetrahymena thermophila SB210]|uniref:Transmembrane protein, putative n=1 Tax=Tetrahymena thermophila (strain SB210) TaxID=312017 RepID=W7X3F6_TETTS|nr:transmembrane protein, putative [Tetrahymena thermophila SB210]EWS73815.1 transmembrane protein, putative [Tetrahymena thermophila SB210]|eukprot:XP_012653638.1 transmembrane protein, putative [Tetrahymena thermophila SB210]